MASGTFTAAHIPSKPFFIGSSDCASLANVVNEHHKQTNTPFWVFTGCSTDPIKVGTTIQFININANNSLGTWTVTSVNATPNYVAFDFAAAIICIYVILFFIGFHTGVTSNGNR